MLTSADGSIQVLSSENWTDVLYTAAVAEKPFGQSALIALFLSAWFLFANCTYAFDYFPGRISPNDIL